MRFWVPEICCRQYLQQVVERTLDTKLDRFHDSEAAAIQQLGDELRCSVHEGEYATHLSRVSTSGTLVFFRERTASLSLSRGVLRNQDQCIHGLILSGRGDIFFTGEMGKEGFDFLFFLAVDVFSPRHVVKRMKRLIQSQ